MSSLPDTIGPYTITREIGRGGMGVVYLARDTKLDRDVAIKALPAELAQDADRLARFEREAKTLAQLNHTNIAGIYGIEEQDGEKYLVLEYVEGETLGDRLDRGALPVDEAIEIAIEIASGVEAAHEAGVIHRDLKPDNIKISPEGKVKVLDFGLARSEESVSSTSSGDQHNSPTIPSPPQHSPTIPGAILGTAAYMSPEQARGRRIDKRTDIWSFGVILYEMLTGIGPFHGETASDSIGAVLHKEIQLNRLPAQTPAGVRRVLLRCLERDRNLRYHDIGDAALDLRDRQAIEPVQVHTRSFGPVALAGWLVAVVAIVAAILVLMQGDDDEGRASDQTVVRLEMAAPPGSNFLYAGDLAGPPVASPRGDAVVFVAREEGGAGRLWVRNLESGAARLLPGTDGATFPFWSPDGASIGFFISNYLRRHDLESGVSYTVCDAPAGRGGTWTAADEILFSPGFQDPIHRVSAGGGEPTPVTTIDATLHTSHRWPHMLSDGRHFLFNAITHDPISQESNMLMVGSLDGGEQKVLLRTPYRAEHAAGMLLYVVEDDLVAAPFDVETLTVSRQRTELAESIFVDPSTWYAAYSASDGGVLACMKSESRAGDQSTIDLDAVLTAEADTIVSIDRLGVTRRIILDNTPHLTHRMANNGWLALTAVVPGQQDMDIWIHDTRYDEAYTEDRDMSETELRVFQTSPEKRITSKPGTEVRPAWSPDGSEIAYGRIWNPDGDDGVFVTTIETGAERRSVPPDPDGLHQVVYDWSPDGEWILFVLGNWVAPVGKLYAVRPGGGEPVLLVDWNNRVSMARLSPDGRWLAVTKQVSGNLVVFVIPFAPAWPDLEIDPTDPEPAWRVSIAEGRDAFWRSNGKELYYLTDTGSVIAVQTEIEGDVFKHDTGTALFQSSFEQGKAIDVIPSPGGERFLLSEVKAGTSARAVITLNWQQLLEGSSRQ